METLFEAPSAARWTRLAVQVVCALLLAGLLPAQAAQVRYQRDQSGKVVAAWIKRGAPFETIRDALDTLAVYDGGRLYLAAGSYEATGPPLAIPSGVRVKGRGTGNRYAEFVIPTNGPNRVLDVQNANGVTIDRISFDANYVNRTPGVNVYGVRVAGTVDGLTIENCRFRNATHAIRVENAAVVTGLEILSNYIRVQDVQPDCADHVATGIFVHPGSSTSGALIEGNEITGDAGSPEGSGGGSAVYFGGDQSTIRGNSIHDYSAGAGRPNGVSKGGIGILILGAGDGNIVDGNILDNVHGDNISIRGTNSEVSNNEVYDSHDQGIVVQNALGARVFGNTVLGTETPALRVLNSSHVEIHQNELRDAVTDKELPRALQAVVALVNNGGSNPGETISDVVIADNIIASSKPLRYGINVGSTAPDDNATTDVLIRDNIFDGEFETEIGWPPADVIWDAREVSGTFALGAAAPNPLRAGATISFTMPRSAWAKIDVIDVRGRSIRTLVDGELPAGAHSRYWLARDDAGKRLPAGVYFLRARCGAVSESRKVTIIR